MKFSDIIGRDELKARLRKMIDDNHIPHAILLEGESGIGKLAIARAFMQYLHCPNKINGEPCGKCPNCIQHQNFNHADVIFSFPIVKKGSSTAISTDYIEQWREFLSAYTYSSFHRWQKFLQNENSQPRIYVSESESIVHKMNMASYSTDYKIVLMWLPEKMNEDCANKLLKIVEEPFPGGIFIFVSDNPKSIISTILSRTQRIKVPKPNNHEIATYIATKFGIEYNAAAACASAANGNIVAAEEALANDSENREFLEVFINMMRKAYTRDLKSLREISVDIYDFKREKIQRFLSYCARMVRENFMMNINPSLTQMTAEEYNFSIKFSPFINTSNAIIIADELSLAERDIAGNGNGKIILFDLLLKLSKHIRG